MCIRTQYGSHAYARKHMHGWDHTHTVFSWMSLPRTSISPVNRFLPTSLHMVYICRYACMYVCMFPCACIMREVGRHVLKPTNRVWAMPLSLTYSVCNWVSLPRCSRLPLNLFSSRFLRVVYALHRWVVCASQHVKGGRPREMSAVVTYILV